MHIIKTRHDIDVLRRTGMISELILNHIERYFKQLESKLSSDDEENKYTPSY